MIVDRKTKEDIPGAHNMFGRQNFPMSGNFNGTAGDFKPQKVHINPKESVQLTQNKPELMKFLQEKGHEVPNFQPWMKYMDNGIMDGGTMEEDFNGFSPSVILQDPRQQRVIQEYGDLFDIDAPSWGNNAVLMQPDLEDGKRVVFTGIPGASGKKLQLPTSTIEDGILRNTMPETLNDMVYAAAVQAFFEAITELGLDYATVIALINEHGHQILDVNTDLNRNDAIALGNYGNMKYADMNKRRA